MEILGINILFLIMALLVILGIFFPPFFKFFFGALLGGANIEFISVAFGFGLLALIIASKDPILIVLMLIFLWTRLSKSSEFEKRRTEMFNFERY